MIVKFKNDFYVPGFGKGRFRKGVVQDVPEDLRDMLPSSAEILEDYVSNDEQDQIDDLKAADEARAKAESAGQKALEKAGMAGLAEEKADEDKPKKLKLSKKED